MSFIKKEVSRRTPTSGTYSKSNEVDTFTLDMNADVSDNPKLFSAITRTVATMMEQISKQICEFEDMRNAADRSTADNFKRVEKEIVNVEKHMEVMELMELIHNTGGRKHDALLAAIAEVGNKSGKTDSKFDRTLEILLDMTDGHGKMHGKMERCLEFMGIVRDSHDGLHAKHKTLETRLMALEKNSNEINTIVKQTKAGQDNLSRGMDQLLKQTDMKQVKTWIDDGHKGLHAKLEGQAKENETRHKKMLDGMPDHTTLMKGVHGLLGDHLGDHSGKMMASINKLPLPPDEKVLLQAIENMQEAALGQTLEAIEKLQKNVDPAKVKAFIDEHGKQMQKTLDSHAKNHDNLAKTLQSMPDHDTLMKGVHGLLGDHMGDHAGKMMASISKLPLPPDEKVLLQAIENMQEAALGQTLEAIEKLGKTVDPAKVKAWIDDHGKEMKKTLDGHAENHENLAKMIQDQPDHDTLMKGVHGLLGDHMGDHAGKMMAEIAGLPLPPDEKVLLQAIENMQEAALGQTLEAIEKLGKQVDPLQVKAWIDDHGKSMQKTLDSHAENHDNLARMMDEMPDHKTLMDGVHGLLGEHMGDHAGKMMSEINNLPLPPDEKVLLQAIENMQEAALGQTMEGIKKIQGLLEGHHADFHGKLDGVAGLLDQMPDHDALMKGVHGLLGDHIGDHGGKVMDEINKLPLPANEKVMLQAMENMEESVMTTILEAIEGVKLQIDGHAGALDDLHGKLGGHGKAVEDLAKMMDGMPDHDALMQGVHGLLGEHLGDGHGKIMSEINNLDLDKGQKVMLQAIENMEESMMTTILEAVETVGQKADPSKVKEWIDDHGKKLHEKLDGHGKNHDNLANMMDGMPDHDTLMKGVHGLLSDHMGDHAGKMMACINNLPLPPDEKILLQAIENMQEASLGQTLEAIENLQKQVDPNQMKAWIDDHGTQMRGILDGHSKTHDNLAQMLDGMPDHDELMKGVHGLLGDHMGDHAGKMMSEINNLPLPPDEKVLLQAIENMQEAALTQTMEAIKGLTETVTGHTNSIHDAFGEHGKRTDDLMSMMDSVPDHDQIMKGVHGLMGEHIGDHGGKVMDEINKLPLPADEKVMLQAMENMEESVLASMLEAIEDLKKTVLIQAGATDALHEKMAGHGAAVDSLSKMMDGMPDHDTLMQGVHGLLGEHLGDGHGKIMSEINNLDLDKGQKVMLQAIENMEESMLTTVLEAIERIQMNVTVQGVKVLDSGDAPAPKPVARAAKASPASSTFASISDSTKTSSTFVPQSRSLSAPKSAVPAPAPKYSRPSSVAGSAAASPAKWTAGASGRLSSPGAASESRTPLGQAAATSKYSGTLSKGPASDTKAKYDFGSRERSSSPAKSADCVACKCGFTCGTEAAMTRHLKNNTDRAHGRV